MKPPRPSFLTAARILLVGIFIFGLLVASPAQPAGAATVTVTNTDDSGAGSLRQAVIDAGSGDTINFHASLAGSTITLSSQIDIDKNLTIDGSGLTSRIRISGNDSVRVFEVPYGVSTSLDHLEIIDGWGGGIYNEGSLTINGCIFSGNNAFSLFGSSFGGAISNSTYSSLSISYSTFVDNYADYGGAIANAKTLTINNSTISGNSAAEEGGGIFNSSGTGGVNLTLLNSTVTGNDARYGGGIRGENFTTVTIANSTISGNSADVSGGEVSTHGTFHLKNSILANSSGGNECYSSNPLATNINNLIEDGSCSPSLTGDPMLGTLSDNGGLTATMALQPSSPAIDAGDDATCEPADQRGISRTLDLHCDIGAYEYASLLMVNSLVDPGDGTCDESECSLREAVTAVDINGSITFDPVLEGGTILIGSEIVFDKDLFIDGSGLDPHIEVSGGDSVRVFKISSGANVNIDHLDIINGSAMIGGGIYNSGVLTVSNSTFSGNNAGLHGGGIVTWDTLTISGTTFTGNNAALGGGGGISTIGSSTYTISNSTFHNNTAYDYGGGIINNSGTLIVNNSTFSYNVISVAGGGIHNTSIGTMQLKNSILANSSGGNDCYNTGSATSINNLIESGSTCGPSLGGDPMLGPLSDNGGPTATMALGSGSPAIDTGNDGTCESTDQRGVSRPQGDHCDIGAYEYEYPYTLFLPLIMR